jgi:hypothetical protein
MLIPGKNINVFDMDQKRVQGSWFTGKMNTQTLDFDPLVTGYAFIIWTKLPFWVEKTYENFADMTQKNFKSFDGLANMDLQTAQYTHTFNGNAYEYATSIQKANTNFSLKHQEFSGNPIKNMYQFWITGIRDPETDIAVYPRAFGCTYGAKNHTGELLYIVTRPDANNVTMNNIEFAAYYTAVMPTSLPLGHFNYSQGTHDSPEIDINFVGDLHLGPEVDNYAYNVLSDADNTGNNTIYAKPYPILTVADFDPQNNGVYSDASEKNLATFATGGWDKENAGISIDLSGTELLAPAQKATSGTNSNSSSGT